MDDCIKNKRNPLKHNNWIDFYKEKENQETKVSSVIYEELKLVA